MTPIQTKVLRFVQKHTLEQGLPPTRQEICTHFGWSSLNSANTHIDALWQLGMLRKPRRNIPRCLLLTDAGKKAIAPPKPPSYRRNPWERR